MKPFVFHLSDQQHPVPNFHLETFESEEEAIRHAQRLLAMTPRYERVSVVLGETVIAEFDRAGV